MSWVNPEFFLKSSRKGLLHYPIAMEIFKYGLTPLMALLTFSTATLFADDLFFVATDQGIARRYFLHGFVKYRWDQVEAIDLRDPGTKYEMLSFKIRAGQEQKVLNGLLPVRELLIPSQLIEKEKIQELAKFLQQLESAKRFFKAAA
jgi:hypothetical protein